MYIIIVALIAFFIVLIMMLKAPSEETLNEIKVIAKTEPEIKNESLLDPNVSEANTILKEKRKYKPRKPKAKDLVEVENNIIEKPKKKYKAKNNII